ncbi:MAG: hypothetical protein ACNS61_06190 [Candidatus Wenzhouxiangella sp. M2_3B_020]
MTGSSNISRLNQRQDNSDTSTGPTVRRTRKGSEELVLRKHGLDENQRQVLLYANGNRSVDELARLVPAIGSESDLLAAMVELGFLAMHDPDVDESGASANGSDTSARPADSERRPDEVRARLRSAVDSIMGSEAGTIVPRIDAARDDDELRRLIAKIAELVELYAGARKREEFLREFDEFLKNRN